MTTIQAKVNTRLLGKASRLFTGTLPGRIIEVLQNARRAGAKHVHISNQDGTVTVRDDGRGIDDFATLLDLGASGWNAKLEASEDPAGVGLFCLAPRQLTVRSKGQKVTIAGDGWTGAAVEVKADPQPLAACGKDIRAGVGTELSFPDEPWEAFLVNPQAAFCGMEVVVDGEPCLQEKFIAGEAFHHRGLGCRIAVAREQDLTGAHQGAARREGYGNNVLVNFHGQVVGFSYQPLSAGRLYYLVDMTGEPTGIRLMLPARTRLVENQALAQLKAALELEAFKYIQRQGQHRLPYKEYLRAKELRIELPEAQETFYVGLLHSDMSPEPVEVEMPKGYSLARCYRLGDSKDGDETDEANVHLLAALGHFRQPLVPVDIASNYDGYSWANLPTIGQVKVSEGKTMHEGFISSGSLIYVDGLSIEVHCSDGKVYRSEVPMAIKPWGDHNYSDPEVYVTSEARRKLSAAQIWHHCGGYSEDGDSYDTQENEFRKELDEFWRRLAGPDEPLRAQLQECVSELKKNWRQITILPDGRVTIAFIKGEEKTILPPSRRQGKGVRP